MDGKSKAAAEHIYVIKPQRLYKGVGVRDPRPCSGSDPLRSRASRIETSAPARARRAAPFNISDDAYALYYNPSGLAQQARAVFGGLFQALHGPFGSTSAFSGLCPSLKAGRQALEPWWQFGSRF